MELSIVLVILGLLVGGVLTGQSLIRAAQLRAVSTEYENYYTAIQSFRDKYFGLPGDLTTAENFWGKDNAHCAADPGTAMTPGTCNGNGDGQITFPNAANATGESSQFWKQLALAGLIAGSYDGLGHDYFAGGNSQCIIGTSCPASKFTGGGWGVVWLGNYTGDTYTYTINFGNIMTFGAADPNYIPDQPILTPADMWNIDTKVDDGMPARGRAIAENWAACTTSTSMTDLTGTYQLSETNPVCALRFIIN